jgi:hypothetical protein
VLREEPVPHNPSSTMIAARGLVRITTEVGSREFSWRGERGLVWSEVRRSVAAFSMTTLQARTDASLERVDEFHWCQSEG